MYIMYISLLKKNIKNNLNFNHHRLQNQNKELMLLIPTAALITLSFTITTNSSSPYLEEPRD